MENWTVITTDHNGNEGLGGGMSKRQMPQQQITNFIDVKSVDEYSSKVERLGGKVVVPKTAIPGMGYMQFVSIQKTTVLVYLSQVRMLSENNFLFSLMDQERCKQSVS